MGDNKAKCVYLNLDKGNETVLDVTTTLAVPLQVEEYGCGLISMYGVVVPTDNKKKMLCTYVLMFVKILMLMKLKFQFLDN